MSNKAQGDERNSATLEKKIKDILRTIYDPEIPVDIYELGLIYNIKIDQENNLKILMTLTTPFCPVAESLPREIELKLKTIARVKEVDIEITFDPPWSPDKMSESAKLKLGYGQNIDI